MKNIIAILFLIISTQAHAGSLPGAEFITIPFLLVAYLLMLILAIAWIIVPFAIIGIKPLIRELIAEVRIANQIRASVHDRGHREPSL
jgi:hypothetical protein